MGSLCGGLSVITKGLNLSLHVMRSVVFSAQAVNPRQVKAREIHFLMSQLEPEASQGFPPCDMASHKPRGMALCDTTFRVWTKRQLQILLSFWYCPETICGTVEEFSGYADVSVLVQPEVMVGKKTELPPGIKNVFWTILSQASFSVSNTEEGFKLKYHESQDFNMEWKDILNQLELSHISVYVSEMKQDRPADIHLFSQSGIKSVIYVIKCKINSEKQCIWWVFQIKSLLHLIKKWDSDRSLNITHLFTLV